MGLYKFGALVVLPKGAYEDDPATWEPIMRNALHEQLAVTLARFGASCTLDEIVIKASEYPSSHEDDDGNLVEEPDQWTYRGTVRVEIDEQTYADAMSSGGTR